MKTSEMIILTISFNNYFASFKSYRSIAANSSQNSEFKML